MASSQPNASEIVNQDKDSGPPPYNHFPTNNKSPHDTSDTSVLERENIKVEDVQKDELEEILKVISSEESPLEDPSKNEPESVLKAQLLPMIIEETRFEPATDHPAQAVAENSVDVAPVAEDTSEAAPLAESEPVTKDLVMAAPVAEDPVDKALVTQYVVKAVQGDEDETTPVEASPVKDPVETKPVTQDSVDIVPVPE